MKVKGITTFVADVLFLNCKVAKETKASRFNHTQGSPGRTSIYGLKYGSRSLALECL